MLPLASLLFSSLMWGLSWLPLHALRAAGIDGVMLIVVAFGTAGVCLLPLLRRQWTQARAHVRWLLLIALLGGLANVCFTLAMSYGEVVRVMVLFYLLPVWGVLGGRVFLGEPITRLRILTVVTALGGAGLILGLDERFSLTFIWQDWLAITCGLVFTGNNLVFRHQQEIPVGSKVAAMLLGAPLCAMPVLLFGWEGAAAPGVMAVLGALAYGAWILVATGTTQFGVTHLPAGRVAILIILELVVAVLSAVLLGEETLAAREWLGVALVLAAAVLETRSGPGEVVTRRTDAGLVLGEWPRQ
ncbi:MAG: DMT family transporter [Gammaproteobacteria bacterium]|nr:DMT family transporter [Gammaproteobacteria bacterium]